MTYLRKVDLYFVVYDDRDNIVGLFLDIDSLAKFFNRRKSMLKYRLSRQDVVQIQDTKVYYIHKFY